MSRVLGVNRTAFHRWEGRVPSQRALEDAFLTERIRKILGDRGAYGSPRCRAPSSTTSSRSTTARGGIPRWAEAGEVHSPSSSSSGAPSRSARRPPTDPASAAPGGGRSRRRRTDAQTFSSTLRNVGGASVRIHFDSLDRFDGEDLEEMAAALPDEAELSPAGTSRPMGVAGIPEVLSEVASIAASGMTIAQAMLFLRDKLGRAQVASGQGGEIEIRPDRKLPSGQLCVETPDGTRVETRPEDLPAALEALRSLPGTEMGESTANSPSDQELLGMIRGPEGCPVNSITDERLRGVDEFLRAGFERGLQLAPGGRVVTYGDPRMKQIAAEVHPFSDGFYRVTLHPLWLPAAGIVAGVLDDVLPPEFGERPLEPDAVKLYAAGQVESDPQRTASRFAATIVDIVKGAAELAGVDSMEPERGTERAGLLRAAGDAFVIGHEYAHIVLGHLSDRPPAGLARFGIEHVTDRHTQERQADVGSLMAVSWALEANGYPPTIASVGALVFFVLQAGVEVARPRLNDRGIVPEVDVAGEYPDVAQRMESALEELERDRKAAVTRSIWDGCRPAVDILLRHTVELSAT